MALLREGDSLVVDGTVQHGIYPSKHDEIEQTVVLRDGHNVQGGIYAKRLRAIGTGRVHGPVLTREDILLDERHLVGGQYQEFLSGLTVPGIIKNEVSALSPDRSCRVDLANATLRIRGPVIADTVHLTNTLVLGNIHARVATLESCIVFGVIESQDQLVLRDSSFVAYRAGRARLIGRLSTWLGYGISDDGGEFVAQGSRPHIEPGDSSDAPSLRYLPICMTAAVCANAEDTETCNLYVEGTCPAMQAIALLPCDFHVEIGSKTDENPRVRARFAVDGTQREEELALSEIEERVAAGASLETFVLRTADGEWKPLTEHPAFEAHRSLRRVLSVTRRILSTADIEKQVVAIKTLAKKIAYFPNLDEESTARTLKEFRDSPPSTRGARDLFDFGTRGAEIKSESVGEGRP